MRSARVRLRSLAAAVGLIALVAASCSSPDDPRAEGRSARDTLPSLTDPSEGDLQDAEDRAGGTSTGPGRGRATVSGSVPGAASGVGTAGASDGITGDTITVVYYWRGDRTRSSPFLQGTGAEANVDEAVAFRAYVDYVNDNASDGATFMGYPFDLHGRTLEGVVVEAGSSPEENVAAAEHIATEIRPFAAIAAHGSVSTYGCRLLAAHGIFNLATYDLDFGLARRTGGHCLPAYASFDAQAEVVQRYVAGRVNATSYRPPAGAAEPRRFGVVYTEYPGLVDSAPVVIERLKRAGVPVVAEGSLSESLAQAQQQAPNVVARFRAAQVNTVIIPDAGTPMSFTHAAEAYGFRPDYVIWPCSGQDTEAMVRLYNASQWTRAQGLTCFDREFRADLTMDEQARRTEWYRTYRQMRDGEPPAQAPLIYSGLLPLLAGVTEAGPNLTADRFRTALDGFDPYRYHAEEGVTSDARNLLLTLNARDRSVIGDFTVLRWSSTTRRSGSTFTGAYTYPENGRRYARDHAFR